jgi:hypothetical protein
MHAPGRTLSATTRYTARLGPTPAPTAPETAVPARPRLTAAPARLTGTQAWLTAGGGADERKSTWGERGVFWASGATRSSRRSGG